MDGKAYLDPTSAMRDSLEQVAQLVADLSAEGIWDLVEEHDLVPSVKSIGDIIVKIGDKDFVTMVINEMREMSHADQWIASVMSARLRARCRKFGYEKAKEVLGV